MITRLLREPLVLFLLAGAAIFALDGLVGDGRGDARLDVTREDVARIRAQWQAQASRPPSDAELQALIEQHVREEILYRESLRLGLDRGDLIVRRRLVQKLTFLSQDLADVDDPSEAELIGFFERNRDRYVRPRRTSFSHVYFSDERAGDSALEETRLALEHLQARPESGTWRDLGDPFMLRREYAERTEQELGELFGVGFAAAVIQQLPGTWRGPISSAYGWHLVRVHKRTPAERPTLDAVRGRVLEDYLTERREEANEAFFRELRARYEVRVHDDEVRAP